MATVTLICVLISSSKANAQSDGTVEQLYAAQCAQRQDTQVCKTLLAGMAADGTNKKTVVGSEQKFPAWGPLGTWMGTSWSDSLGGVSTSKWIIPGFKAEVVLIGTESAGVINLTMKDKGVISGEMVGRYGPRISFTATLPADDTVSYDFPSINYRQTVVYSDRTSSVVAELFRNGQWVEVQKATSELLEREQVERAIAVAEAAYSAAPPISRDGWGMLPNLAGSWWRGPNGAWIVQKARSDRVGGFGRVTQGPDGYQVGAYDSSGALSSILQLHFQLDKKGKLQYYFGG